MRCLLTVFVTLLCLQASVRADGPKKLLLLAQGPDGHPAQTHEYEAGLKILHALLAKTPNLETMLVKADEPWRDGPELLAKADGAVLFLSEGAKWLSNDPKRLAAFQDLAKRNAGGLTCLHWAMGTKDAKNIDAFVELFGGCHGGPDRKYQVLTADFKVGESQILRGVKDFSARDEFYYHLKLAKRAAPLLQTAIDGKLETVAWTMLRPDGGQSFGFSGLHFHENWRLPEYRRFIVQGVLWTMKLPIPANGVSVDVGK